MSKHLLGLFLLLSAAGDAALAQSTLPDELKAKTSLSVNDRAVIETWIEERVGRFDRATKEQDRSKQRVTLNKVVDEIVKAGADGSAEFRDAFGQVCAAKLGGFVTLSDMPVALQAALMFARLPAAGTREAYLTALTSPHAPVRYHAARSIKQIQPLLKSAEAFEPVLQALGQAGAAETDRETLAAIYAAIDFSADANDFAGKDAEGKALAAVLEGRIEGLAARRKRHEAGDIPGLAAVTRIAPALKGNAVAQRLARVAAEYLSLVSLRYGQVGPEGGGVTLAPVAEACEAALVALVQGADGAAAPPGEAARVARRIREKSDARAVDGALAAWVGAGNKPGALNGAPWNLPNGLKE